MPKISFSAIMHNDKKIIKTLSGRVGNFIFRTSPDGQIKAFFKPRPGTGPYRGNIETISNELREGVPRMALRVKRPNSPHYED